ncbi:MAG: 30S ribosomal protein S3ae [Nitrososphaerota archaeon]|nr:30S ribosomal protein S3ae [Candidatus Calditenuaceae archaeon]MDW8073239.1 30S ribosomal protein S3ae [Nitrososphaerota archaeon]
MSSKKPAAKGVKSEYIIKAPPYFAERIIGVTFSDNPSKLLNRTLTVSLYALTDDPTKQYILVKFQVVNVEGNVAKTIYYGHEYDREFLRSLVRRGTSKIDGYYNVETMDGYRLRLQCTVFTHNRARSGKRASIYHIMKEIVESSAKKLELGQLAQEVVVGKTASDIYNAVKRILIPRHVGVVKSKVLAKPLTTLTEERPAAQ